MKPARITSKLQIGVANQTNKMCPARLFSDLAGLARYTPSAGNNASETAAEKPADEAMIAVEPVGANPPKRTW
ncbi:hypothetical protein EOS_14780 [Caballeronia mineralivorans PML1(12)]|uniref:Uncharacterized protein n=1 Tax=Caballeronia mineralivorans PML1(12) TaxID=908627 RepID=A0A0J1CXZ1_9BURK|nr:hypothetical protein EOS_14780 [Caballeronia mineralivorans PML1(12)]